MRLSQRGLVVSEYLRGHEGQFLLHSLVDDSRVNNKRRSNVDQQK
jgi:hypothetical protein